MAADDKETKNGETTTTTTTNVNEILKKMPWKTRIFLSMLSLVTDSSRRRDGTMNRRLLSLFDFRTPTRSGHSVSSSDHSIDSSRALWIRTFTPNQTLVPSDSPPLPVILFFHGGGFAFLSPDGFAYDAVCRRIAAEIPAVVASVNYRLSPEHKFPCQYQDGFEALRFLESLFPDENQNPVSVDLKRCFLVGDSAGGNLAHHVAVRACRDPPPRARVAGVFAIQPFFGGEERTESETRLGDAPVVNLERTDWMWRAFLPEGEDRDHPAANVSGPRGEDLREVSGFPRTAVVVGGLDPLQDWQRRYYKWLLDCGKEAVLFEYPDAIHAFYIFPELPQSKSLILKIKDFVLSSS